MREHEAREAVGQRRFADALGTADQPGVVHAPRSIRVEQRRLGVAASKPRGLFLGRGPPLDPVETDLVVSLGRRHQAALSMRRAATACQTSWAVASSDCAASMTTQRCVSALAMARNAARRASCSARSSRSKAVGLLSRRLHAPRRPRETGFHGQVEDDR